MFGLGMFDEDQNRQITQYRAQHNRKQYTDFKGNLDTFPSKVVYFH